MKIPSHRVVITGMGAVSAYGAGAARLIDGALRGVNTIEPIDHFNSDGLPARIASSVQPSILEGAPQKYASKASRMAWHAAHEAIQQSGTQPQALAAAIGWSAPDSALLESGPDKIEQWNASPFFTESEPGHSAQQLYHELHCKGPLFTDHAACSAGLHSFAHAARVIRSGEVKTCLAGASDSRVHPAGIIGYARLGVLNTEDAGSTSRASRPFNRDRSGFVVGEGAGFLVLEALDHALARGATILGELKGWALTNDAHNLTDPASDGSGAVTCIKKCLQHAGCHPSDIHYINAHGTSTRNNDHMESKAYRTLWPTQQSPYISATKSIIGHLSMASSAVESLVTLGALDRGILPPTLNYTDPDPVTSELNIIGSQPLHQPVQTALKTAYGLGGQNAAIVLERWQA